MRHAVVVVLLALAACGGGSGSVAPNPPPPPPPPAPVASVTVSGGPAGLVPQQTTQLTATPKDAAGNPLSGRSISWSSSAAGVAAVNAGLVTGVSTGSATITATSEGQSGTATITVQDGGLAGAAGGTVTAAGGNVAVVVPAGAVAASVAITVAAMPSPPSAGTLVPGTAYDFGPNGTQFSQPVTLRIKYDASQVPAGSDPSLFRLHLLNGGAWEAVPGSTVDVATRVVSGPTTHFSGYAVAQIPPPVASVTLSPSGPIGLFVSGVQQLSATPKDASGNPLTGRVVTWSTSASGVATVSATGLTTGVAIGNATITATSEGVSAQAAVSVTALPPFALTQISVGGGHTCGLTAGGAAWCWGSNLAGQLGDGTTTQRLRPVPVPNVPVFTEITAGQAHTCGLTAAGVAWCWGANASGAVGDNSTTHRLVPAPVQNAPAFASISAGFAHTCARTALGQAWCWGQNQFAALGDGTTTDRLLPVQVSSPFQGGLSFVQISAGASRTCGRTQPGTLYCWGANSPGGILGVGSLATLVSVPAQVQTAVQFAWVGSGAGISCATAPAGSMWCWGLNSFGQVGDNSTTDRAAPVQVGGATTFATASPGQTSSCARSTIGEAWCWGVNVLGSLGNGTFSNSSTPVRITGHTFVQVASGLLGNSCGLKASGETWCWGYNVFGQLGDGTTTNRPSPVRASP